MTNLLAGVRGRLVSASFAREVVSNVDGAEPAPLTFSRSLSAWRQRCEAQLGPASSVRAVADIALLPLLRLLGLSVTNRCDGEQESWLELRAGGRSTATAITVGWNEPLSSVRRTAIVRTISSDARWCFCCNGTALRIIDGRRTWSRDYLEFDLSIVADEPPAQSLLWSIARAEALAATPPVLDRAVLLSARHGVEVCRALGEGVLDALRLVLGALAQRGRRYTPDVLFEHSLTVLYRILFLLFAEARGLVPMWHPLYREQYSIDAIVDRLLSRGRYRGLWLAIQAISRLAHTGCSAGELTVTAFNGRLFSPVHAAVFDRTRIDDESLGRAVIAVTTTSSGRGERRRIAYRDLDVEQLGAVYEQVLDYQPAPPGGTEPLVRTGDRRKSSGTFYTPRAVTSFVVRRALEPLLAGRSSADILKLRILDPAMGSGAFLVAACRYLAAAVEDALIREGRWLVNDVSPADRVMLRRDIASRCLFGVDLNPMAVQLARLSIWLATLSANEPLSFLDHHLVVGDSLVGAAPADVARQPTREGRRRGRTASLPLLDDTALASTLANSVRVRMKLADPDTSASVVRTKEHALAALQDPSSGLGRWWRTLDLWCAGWFWQEGAAPDRGTFGALVDRVLHDRRALPERAVAPLLRHSEALAQRHRFLHWPLTFPEVFVDEAGEALATPGFDAIVGNPPWDMVRADSGDPDVRVDRRLEAQRLTDFVRESGVYRVESRAHANRYQLFVERALQLVRPGGRIGLVLPSGLVSDAGGAPLRRHLFERAAVDDLIGLDNREAIFPIHRSVRFVLLTCTMGQPTSEIHCRFGISNPEELDRIEAGDHSPLVLTRRFLSRLSGEDDLGIPELTGLEHLRLVERVSATVPRLASPEGWSAHFGRELNASDDRDAFTDYIGEATGRPIVEGKQIEPFRVALERSRYQMRTDRDVSARAPRRPRVAYRDVASATNRLTLIAALLPARAVTTHTLFCLKTPLPADAQHVLCALLNSYVTNYLVRLRVNTHVTVALVSRLPVPLVRPGEAAFERLSTLSRTLMTGRSPVEEMDEYAELQGLAAQLYGLSAAEFELVLETFPLVPNSTKAHALRRLRLFYEDDTPRH